MIDKYVRYYSWYRADMIPLFLVVTTDKYRLPVMVCDSMEELAERAGVALSTVIKGVQKFNRGKKTKYEVVWIEKEDFFES